MNSTSNRSRQSVVCNNHYYQCHKNKQYQQSVRSESGKIMMLLKKKKKQVESRQVNSLSVVQRNRIGAHGRPGSSPLDLIANTSRSMRSQIASQESSSLLTIYENQNEHDFSSTSTTNETVSTTTARDECMENEVYLSPSMSFSSCSPSTSPTQTESPLKTSTTVHVVDNDHNKNDFLHPYFSSEQIASSAAIAISAPYSDDQRSELSLEALGRSYANVSCEEDDANSLESFSMIEDYEINNSNGEDDEECDWVIVSEEQVDEVAHHQ